MESVALLGIPSDAHSSFLRGPAAAPDVVRHEMFSDQGNPYTELGVDLRASGAFGDAGNVEIRDDDGDFDRIEAAVSQLLAKRSRVLAIGGDHAVTYAIVRAYAKQYPALNIVHVDAHPDFYEEFGGDRFSHACPFARIKEDGLAAELVQIGIRTMSPAQRREIDRYGSSVQCFGAWEIDRARAALPAGAVYVTIDMDGLDPAFAPGVSHREPGGLTVRDVLETIKAIPGNVVGGDVVEFNPSQDVGGLTAAVAAKLARELAGRMIADAKRAVG